MQSIHMGLFMGQSNMAGRGVAALSPAVTPGMGYEFRAISAPEQLHPMQEPFGERENNPAGVYEPGMKTGSMVSAMVLRDLILEKNNPYAPVFNPSRGILKPQLGANALETTVNLLRPTRPRCPHLGCALHWNPQERSWDCSCHGSRFDHKGKRLNNPAQKDLEL